MKRIHINPHVDEPTKSIGSYSQLFAGRPLQREGDCGQAAWCRAPIVIRRLPGAL